MFKKGGILMKRYQNKLAIDNPFRLYKDKNGEVEILDIDENPTSNFTPIPNYMKRIVQLPRENRIRITPYLTEVSEDFFLENIDILDFQDIQKTQPWADNPSPSVKLALELNLRDENVLRVNEEIFVSTLLNYVYFRNNETKEPVKIEDIDYIHLKITYFYDTFFNFVNIDISHVKFYDPNIIEIKKTKVDDDYYSPKNISLSLSDGVADYFFGNSPSTGNIFSAEYLLTPAMIFDANLYNKIKDKITSLSYIARRGDDIWT
jgi:hypothetical protein